MENNRTPPLADLSPSTTTSVEEMDDSFVDLTLEEFTTFNLEPDGPHSDLLNTEDGLAEEIKKVEPLRPEQIRWFYLKNGTNSTRLKPMCGNDSLRLENAYRKFIAGFQNCKKRVTVRGGLFEVDLPKKACFPIYWINDCEEEGEPVLRGTWFYNNWFPLSLENAERIEREHQARWKGYDIRLIKELINNRVMHSVKLREAHVEWKSVTNVILYKDSTVSRAVRNVGKRVGISKAATTGYQIHRGYHQIAEMSDHLPPIGNLMLVVHGIGAKVDRSRVVRNTNDFRALCRKFEDELGSKTRSVYLPIEWRSRLKLNEDQVTSITPHKSITIRRFIHTTALDIMYYTSPLYRKELVNGLRKELNRVYRMFIERNPSFNGRVNLFCHSLGNIIFHDICTNWQPDYDEDGVDLSYEKNLSSKKQQKGSKKTPGSGAGSRRTSIFDDHLIFKPHVMFCLGSPLGIFLTLRGVTPDGIVDRVIPPPCKLIYNIYHPADPVAYRLEPLVYEHYSHVKPVEVDQYAPKESSAKKARRMERLSRVASEIPLHRVAEEPVHARAGASLTDESSVDGSEYSSKQSYLKVNNYKSIGRSMAGGAVRFGSRLFNRSTDDAADATGECDNNIFEAVAPDMDEHELDPNRQGILPRRMDYVLQEGLAESKFGYGALTSHTSYWRNPDLARFITLLLQDSEDELDIGPVRLSMQHDAKHTTAEDTTADSEPFPDPRISSSVSPVDTCAMTCLL